jgi:molybdopterin converting factor small subunit
MPTVTVEVLFWLKGRLGYADDGEATLALEIAPGESVGSLLARLAADRAGFAEHVFDVARGLPYDHVVVLLNRQAVELKGGMDAVLTQGDELALLPGFAGGQRI